MVAVQRFRWSKMVARGGVEPPTYRFSGGRSYQLSYLAEPGAVHRECEATQTGLEPATFAVTGRRANQLRHWALLFSCTASEPYPQRDSNPRCRLERAES
jgi:hypothetical protein